jgi:hypothetical protein
MVELIFAPTLFFPSISII